jgi:hypothetical protein
MKTRVLALTVVVAFAVASCGGSESADRGVASLDRGTIVPAETERQVSDVEQEQALLEFTGCMRDNGVDIGDPTVDADGNATLDFRGIDIADLDEDAIAVARDACAGYLDGVTLGFDLGDPTELQDTALEFAQCIRANGYDLDDPDFSSLSIGMGGEDDGAAPGGSPFGDVDLDDPAFQAAFDSCSDVLADIGGPAAGTDPSDS